uniref:Anillin n=1 Tax=Fundulus heteroclitus TaxID=8078 RepID=A0A3Q2QYF3_FUNHE
MDPFTEKLLERTRARRENLQRKLAERPNAVSRQMVKRPLTESNSTIADPARDKAPQISSKPSPSKRRCSEENNQSAPDEENQGPVMTRPVAPAPSDPLTDKKPPVGPASVRSSTSLEKTSARAARCQAEGLKAAQPENAGVTPGPDPLSDGGAATAPAGSGLQRNRADPVEDPAPSAAGMKSRLQRLAQQRKCWDGDDGSSDAVQGSPPLTLVKRPADAQPPTTPPASEAPVGRRGRLANLAATIGSWEDDLSHAHIPKEKPATGSVAHVAVKVAPVAVSSKQSAALSSSATASRSAFNSKQDTVHSTVKSSRVVPPSPQKAEIPASRPAVQSEQNPLKNSKLGAALPPSPHKTSASDAASAPQSPVKTPVFPRIPNHTASPHKPQLCDRPAVSVPLGHQEKVTVGGPGVKSFLERFGERCQEHKEQSSTPARVPAAANAAPGTPSVTPNTKLVQERLRVAQAAHTATAELTQRQKMERESELAQIRSRFQKGKNVWENQDKQADNKEPPAKATQRDISSCDSQDEATAPSTEELNTPSKCPPPACPGIMMTPPASASSPMRMLSQAGDKLSEETLETTKEEMNVDQSIDSAVINELFDGVLEQSGDQEEEEDEEEDALNISSMSLLMPLAETVAAVVKSPERRLMTSTPASSFLVKSNTPEIISIPDKPQRANVAQTSSSSSDSVDFSDDNHKLPYSIDAYRSIRVKEPERAAVKQVIVRKEDVSKRVEEPRAASLFSVKQKMKMLTNEVNLQQTVIHQASQALNCCVDEEHGKGSQVEAEAERLLLVATEKREALKAELDLLKGDPSGQKRLSPTDPEPAAVCASKGSITLQELRLPLKADFVCSTANKPDSTKHSFFIMIRAGVENTVATPLASTHRGLSGDTLTFPTKFTLSDVSSDFKIDLEVYCLEQKREICSEKKKKPNKSKTIWREVSEAHSLCMSAITPKRFLTITKSAQTPVVASPGGPNAVRTSNFVLVGSHALTLSSIGKNKFPLEKVPFLCPLEGHIHLRMQCEVGSRVEERGFLTMFEDVSGFGAWHRRWCVLSGYCISYWTYPDDEKRKNPIGRINLANCTSKMVEPANREFCARPNTFELITVRPQREDDKETLVSQCMNTMCVTKYVPAVFTFSHAVWLSNECLAISGSWFSLQKLAERRHQGRKESVDEEAQPDSGGSADVATRRLLQAAVITALSRRRPSELSGLSYQR